MIRAYLRSKRAAGAKEALCTVYFQPRGEYTDMAALFAVHV